MCCRHVLFYYGVLPRLFIYPVQGGPVSLGRKMSTNKDDKSFLIAPLFDGQRGPMFLAWSKKFLDAAEGKGNEDFSYADVFRAW